MTGSKGQNKKIFIRFLIPIVIILLLMLGGLYLAKMQIQPSSKENNYVRIEEGSVLPDFKLTSIDDKTINVSELNAKVMMINFWATWCDACMEELPSIVKLRENFQHQGFEVVGINVDDNPEKVVPKVVQEFNIRFPIYKDTNGSNSDLFDVHAIPLTVFIDRQRKILQVVDGGLNWNSDKVHSRLSRWLSQ